MKREVSFLWGTWYTLKLVSWYAGKGGWGIEAIYLRQYLTEFARQYQDSTLSLAPIFPIQSHNFISKCISSMANKQIERLSKVYFPILKKKKRVTSARGKLGLTKIFQKSVINIKRWLLYIYAWQIAIAIKKNWYLLCLLAVSPSRFAFGRTCLKSGWFLHLHSWGRCWFSRLWRSAFWAIRSVNSSARHGCTLHPKSQRKLVKWM